jgi:hypothetical protein
MRVASPTAHLATGLPHTTEGIRCVPAKNGCSLQGILPPGVRGASSLMGLAGVVHVKPLWLSGTLQPFALRAAW